MRRMMWSTAKRIGEWFGGRITEGAEARRHGNDAFVSRRFFHVFSVTLWLCALCGFLLVGCEASDSPSTRHGTGGQRLVSLSPAITQMIIDLECGEQIVGVGAFDPVAPEGMVVVGDLYRIDYEKLLSLKPTDIFIQPSGGGVPARLKELAARNGWRIHAYRIDTLADVFGALTNTNAELQPTGDVGTALNKRREAEALMASIEGKLLKISRLTSGRARPDVLVLVGTDPLVAVGPGTFLNDLLAAVNGHNVMSDALVPYPGLNREDVLAHQPDVIIVLSGAPPEEGKAWEVPPSLAGLKVIAVVDERVHRVAGPTVLLPSTGVANTAARLAKLLHPDVAGEIDAVTR